jgi:predicted ribosome quality control (RQC) complex YloA/Tae2 family protein
MDAMCLLAASEEMRRALLDGVLRTVQPAGAAGLWIELVTHQGLDSLLITADEAFPHVVRGASRPPKSRSLTPFAGLVRRLLTGSRLEAVVHQGLERILRLEFAAPFPSSEDSAVPGGRWCLIAELFAPRPNLILVDPPTGRILAVARLGPTAAARPFDPGHPYLPPSVSSRSDPRLLRDAEAIRDALIPRLAATGGAAAALRLTFLGLTDLWAAEVVSRAGETTPAALANALLVLIQRIETGPWEPHLLLGEDGNPIGVSPLRLSHLPDIRQQPTASLAEAAAHLAGHLATRRRFEARGRTLRQVLRRLEARLRSRRAKLAEESSEFAQADAHQRMGEALVAHQSAIPRGATEVTLADPARGEGGTLAIPLDPAVPLAANAERFFKSARRGRRGALRVAARLAETDADLVRVQTWNRRLASAANPEDLDAVRQEVAQAPHLLAPNDRAALGATETAKRPSERVGQRRAAARRDRDAGPAPRRFLSSDGLPILVGRDNEGNDYLTVHLARSEDLWLHVEGFPGSHVVIRPQNRTSGIPRRTLIEAAQIAAYYSQARSHGKVTVSYTLRKYVRKPRKSPPGLVTITQEKTIVVSPDKALISKLASPDD